MAYAVAQERIERDRKAGLVDRKFTNRDGIEYEGVISEFTAARWLNVFPDLNTDPTDSRRPDGLWQGFRYDAKHCSRESARWSIAGHKAVEHPPDFFVFTYGPLPKPGDMADMMACGWLTLAEVIRHQRDNLVENPHAKTSWFFDIADRHLRRGHVDADVVRRLQRGPLKSSPTDAAWEARSPLYRVTRLLQAEGVRVEDGTPIYEDRVEQIMDEHNLRGLSVDDIRARIRALLGGHAHGV